MKYFFYYIPVYVLMVLLFNSCGIKRSLKDRPDISGISAIDTSRIRHNDSLFSIGKNTLLKNKFGVWELYVEGDGLERGLITGSLTRELIHKQETAFMQKIKSLVPKESSQNFLRKIIFFFNRKMPLYIPGEYKSEIYGVSRFALEDYNSFAPPYLRSLYLHGAHDIGHALQDLMLVGCTSFAAWDSKTEDGQLLLGRNFDFYAGDKFAEEKIAAFVNPDEGHKFMMYTWGGMIGVVSGLNEKGITVTINAGKSKIPLIAKTPVSLVAREILQYAQSTSEAIEIARKREVFVSEAIMIGSASERKAIVIEVSPRNFGVFEVQNKDQLICSNHFQSEIYREDRRNLKQIEENHTAYRFDRMEELLEGQSLLNPAKAVELLRNRKGMGDTNLGMGNEKAINQLLAHHGIVFKPGERKVWISANPYQLGAFLNYDLDEVFKKFHDGNVTESVADPGELIPEDDFVNTENYRNYERFRDLRRIVELAIATKKEIPEEKLAQLIQLNPNFWKSYALAGEYFYQQKKYKKAVISFKQALQREVSTVPEQEWLERMIRKSYRKV